LTPGSPHSSGGSNKNHSLLNSLYLGRLRQRLVVLPSDPNYLLEHLLRENSEIVPTAARATDGNLL
jgi:hypothetical protein